MLLKLETRSKDSYLEKLTTKAVSTRRNFNATYQSFEKFCQEKYDRTAEEIIQEIPQEKDSEYDILQAWINWLSQSIIPSTIHTRFSSLMGYFHYRGIKMYKEDVKQNISLPKIPKEEKHPLSIEEIRKIINEANFKKKALYLTLLSSGMRVGEAVQLKKKHFDTSEKNLIIKIPANFTKTKKARTVFISKEASSAVRPLLKKIDDDDTVFSKNENPHYAVCAEEMTFKRILRNVGLVESYESSRTNKITMHSFRAYFFTKAVRKHDENYAHMMIGHGGYLMQYDRLTDDEKFEMYLELEPDLTADPTERQKITIEKQQKELSKTKELEQSVKMLQEQQIETVDTLSLLLQIANGKGQGYTDDQIEEALKRMKPEIQKVFRKYYEVSWK